MSHLVASSLPISGSHAVKRYAGFGILGADIPTTGDSGGSPVLNDGIEPSGEYYWRVETPPSDGVLVIYDDLSVVFDAAGLADNSYPWSYRLFETGVDAGVGTVVQTVGTGGISTVISTAIASYTVRSAVQSDSVTSYSIREAIQQDTTSTYVIRGLVAQDVAPTYSIRGSVSSDASSAYNILSATSVSASVVAGYNIRGSVDQATVASYSLRGSVTQDTSATYSILSASSVSSSVAAGYAIKGSVQSSIVAGYSIDYASSGLIRAPSGSGPTAIQPVSYRPSNTGGRRY